MEDPARKSQVPDKVLGCLLGFVGVEGKKEKMSRCAMDGGEKGWDERSGVDISISRGASRVQKFRGYVRFFSFLFPSFLFFSLSPCATKTGIPLLPAMRRS